MVFYEFFLIMEDFIDFILEELNNGVILCA